MLLTTSAPSVSIITHFNFALASVLFFSAREPPNFQRSKQFIGRGDFPKPYHTLRTRLAIFVAVCSSLITRNHSSNAMCTRIIHLRFHINIGINTRYNQLVAVELYQLLLSIVFQNLVFLVILKTISCLVSSGFNSSTISLSQVPRTPESFTAGNYSKQIPLSD